MKSFLSSVIVAAIISLARLPIIWNAPLVTPIFERLLPFFEILSAPIQPQYFEEIKTLISFLLLTIVCGLGIFTINILKPIVTKTSFVVKKEKADLLFRNLKDCHERILVNLQINDAKLNEQIENVWIEYICADIKQALISLYGADRFRVGVFVLENVSEINRKNELVDIATSSVQPPKQTKTKFEIGEGFCGRAFEEKIYKCGARRLGWRGFWRKNDTYSKKGSEMHIENRNRSFLSLPIEINVRNMHNNKIVGVLCIDSTRKSDFLRETKDILLLNSLLQLYIVSIIGGHLEDERYGT